MEIALLLCTILMPLMSIMVISKYKLIDELDGINKLYEYSKYLILKIESLEELESNKDFKKFENYIKRNNKVFLVIHTNLKIIKAEKLNSLSEDKFNKFFKELKNIINYKELKISIFNLKDSNSEEKDFFWSIVNYKNFRFVKYITINNLTYFFGFTISILLILFNILNQKTLYNLGIPLQLSLVNLFDFGQFVLYNNLGVMSIFLYGTIFLSPIILVISGIIYFFKNRKDKLGNKILIDHALFGTFYLSISIFALIFIIFITSLLISIYKIN